MKGFLEPRVAFALVAGLYLLAFPYHPGLRSPNELCRLWQARALVDHGTLSINDTLREYGYVGDLSVYEGRYYPSKAPGLSFAAAPIYWVMKKVFAPAAVGEVQQMYWSRLLLTVAPTLFLLWLMRRFLAAYLSAKVRDAVLVTYALGSLAFSYSELFMSHQTTAVLLFGCFYAAWKTLRGEWGAWGWAVAGVCSGLSVVAEYTAALTVVAIAFYVVRELWLRSRGDPKQRARSLASAVGLVVVGAAPFLALLMAYHQAAFGHPLVSGYKYLNDANYQGWHVGGFLGIRGPDASAFVLSFFSPLRGLFTLSPWVAVGLFGIALLRAERGLFWFLVVLSALNAYFTSAFTYSSWGWCIGPRHLTPWLPFLVLPLGKVFEKYRAATAFEGRLIYGAALGTCLSSIGVAGILSLLNYVPDDMSTAFFALAVPLLESGYYAPSVFALLRVAQPTAGLPLYVLLAGGAAWAALTLRGEASQRAGAVTRAAVLVVAAHLFVLKVTTKYDDHDVGGLAHLKRNWLTPPAPR